MYKGFETNYSIKESGGKKQLVTPGVFYGYDVPVRWESETHFIFCSGGYTGWSGVAATEYYPRIYHLALKVSPGRLREVAEIEGPGRHWREALKTLIAQATKGEGQNGGH